MGGNAGMYGAPQQQMGYGAPHGQGQGQYSGGMGQQGRGGYGAPQGQYGGGGYGGAPQGQYGAPQGGGYGQGGVAPGGYGQQPAQQRQAYSAHHGYNAAPSAPKASDLPPGWEAHVDPSTKNTYYHNKASGVTQWQKP